MDASHLVPTIDIAQPDDKTLAALDLACRDHGFFLLSGHGLDDLIAATWTERAHSSKHLGIARWL